MEGEEEEEIFLSFPDDLSLFLLYLIQPLFGGEIDGSARIRLAN